MEIIKKVKLTEKEMEAVEKVYYFEALHNNTNEVEVS